MWVYIISCAHDHIIIICTVVICSESVFVVYVYVRIHTRRYKWYFTLFLYITQDGYKEREDRIAELEEFINDQVAELDRMEEAMKQTVANKEIFKKDYQEVNEQYSLAKVCAM